MIPIPEKMKLNVFKKVHLPRNKDLLARYGIRYTANGKSADEADFVNFSNRKLDSMMEVSNEIYQAYAKEQAERARASQAGAVAPPAGDGPTE